LQTNFYTYIIELILIHLLNIVAKIISDFSFLFYVRKFLMVNLNIISNQTIEVVIFAIFFKFCNIYINFTKFIYKDSIVAQRFHL
jgi:hypothetical protein